MKQLPYLCFCLLTSINLSAQNITISGFVSDAATGEKLIGATVYLPSLQIGTRTNTYGFYSLTAAQQNDSTDLRSSYTSFARLEKRISLSNSQKIDIALEKGKVLKEVIISAKDQTPTFEKTQMSSISLPMEDIKKLPAFMGEVDIIKAIQLLPGIQAGSEGQTGIYVRGGGPDQNLILLDGIPVYNASHLFGFFSVFNADAVKEVDVYKGGFPARYGGRLSSVIDIKLKEGNTKEVKGKLGIGLIASRLTLEGPINKKKQKGSWMFSGRRTYIDALTTPIIKIASKGTTKGGYFFHDLNLKANYPIGEKDHIYLSGYFGKDKFFAGYKDPQFNENFDANIDWGNTTALARWNHIYSPKLFGNLSFTYSKYRFNIFSEISSQINDSITNTFSALYFSSIRDWTAKYDFDFIPNNKHFIKTGIAATYHKFTPGAINLKDNLNPEANIDTAYNVSDVPEFSAYIEDDWEISKKFKANIGVHAAGFKTENNFYTSIQPRISTRFLVGKRSSFKASFAQMSQFIHLLTNNGIGLPTDLWVPVTDAIKPQLSNQIALGYSTKLSDQFELSIESYYKTMNNVIEYKDGSSFLNTNNSWEDKVEMGKGWSYGGELFLQKKIGRLTGLMGYTLSWTNRQFENINFGKKFPYKFDRRHDFKVAGVYKLSKRVELSGEWIYGTGNAITLPEARFNTTVGYGNLENNFGGGDVFYYNGRNGRRMRAYHRFDLGINVSKELRKGRKRTWNFGIYNLYSRKNPYFIYSQYDYMTDAYKFYQISLFPILPSFNYNLTF